MSMRSHSIVNYFPTAVARIIALLVAVITAAVAANAQSSFERLSLRGQFRDAVIDPGGQALFVAVYDRNEVIKIDLESGKQTHSVEVGKGPSALAMSGDGASLACVNRLSGTVTLIRPLNCEVIATVECGNAPGAVAALPGGRFAVANAFSDSVTLIDARTGRVSATLDSVASVPNGIAATATLLGVTTREPAALWLFAVGSPQKASARIDLGGTPRAIAAMDNGLFVVGTERRILVVDGAARRIVAERGLAVAGLTVSGNRILAVEKDTIHVYDASLNELDTVDTAGAARAIAAGGDWVIALDPAARSIEVRGPHSLEKLAESPTAMPPAQEEAPLETPTRPDVKLEPVTPIRQEEKIKGAAVIEPEQETIEAAPSDPIEPEAKPREKRSVRKRRRRQELERQLVVSRRHGSPMVGAFESRAPRLGRAPSISVSEILSKGVLLSGSEGGLRTPDWTQPFKNVTAHVWEGSSKRTLWEGDVELEIDDTFIHADRIWRDLESGEMRLEGNVSLRQQDAWLTADRLIYRIPPEDQLSPQAEPRPIEDPSERAKRRLRLGELEGEGIHLVEAHRELEADYIKYALATESGELQNAHGRIGPLYFDVKSLHVAGPEEMHAEEFWVTTCDRDPPHYRIRIKEASLLPGQVVLGKNARFQLGRVKTPLILPRWRKMGDGRGGRPFTFDVDSGHRAEIGYFINVAQWFEVTPSIDFALRVLPTTKEGLGYGVDLNYDFMKTPASPLFRGKGSFHTLHTTEERGYTEWYHRQELGKRTLLLAQWEQWYDRDFVKDFFHDVYRDRTAEPRTFLNATHLRDGQILTGSYAESTHDFTRETEKIPELTYHLLERNIGGDLYFSLDSAQGYYQRVPSDILSGRSVSVARLTYHLALHDGLDLTAFGELNNTWYSKVLDDGGPENVLSGTAGLTLQTRLHKAYPGRWGFSRFKHILMPSMTYSYRPESRLEPEVAPRFDALDNRPGRTRIETKIDNIVLGRDAETGEEWQVARLTLYQGNDFWNEIRRAEDYELEVQVFPAPWWALVTIVEHHSVDEEFDFERDLSLTRLWRFFPRAADALGIDPETYEQTGTGNQSIDRVLAYFQYDLSALGGNWNGRLGYAFTDSGDKVLNREVFYGVGYRFSDKWSVAFEHRYDFERSELVRQRYEVRRRLHRWEMGLALRERESGYDLNIEFTLLDFQGARLKL